MVPIYSILPPYDYVFVYKWKQWIIRHEQDGKTAQEKIIMKKL